MIVDVKVLNNITTVPIYYLTPEGPGSIYFVINYDKVNKDTSYLELCADDKVIWVRVDGRLKNSEKLWGGLI